MQGLFFPSKQLLTMGTNHYLYPRPDCEHCGRPFERLHIGKSSYGWCYSLHVIPEEGINTLQDWQALWEKPGALIRDEYGTVIEPSQMLDTIANRSHNRKQSWEDDWWRHRHYYKDEEDFHRQNHSQRGPHFLLRHRNDGQHCIGNGEGTYDYIVGEFS